MSLSATAGAPSTAFCLDRTRDFRQVEGSPAPPHAPALRRGVADAAADLPNKAEVRGLAEGLDVLMLEVERIAEGQRFVAKLLAERAALPAALPAVAPAARREPGQITPH